MRGLASGRMDSMLQSWPLAMTSKWPLGPSMGFSPYVWTKHVTWSKPSRFRTAPTSVAPPGRGPGRLAHRAGSGCA